MQNPDHSMVVISRGSEPPATTPNSARKRRVDGKELKTEKKRKSKGAATSPEKGEIVEWDTSIPQTSSQNLSIAELQAFVDRIEALSTAEDIAIKHPNELREKLRNGFTAPFMYRRQPLSSKGATFGIQEMVAHLSGIKGKEVSVYDYAISNPTERTYNIRTKDLPRFFPKDSEAYILADALNLLDLPNATGHTFIHPEITEFSLRQQDDPKAKAKGKAASKKFPKSAGEWFLLSMSDAISTIHTDKAGLCTWTMILQGGKTWYYARNASARDLRYLFQAGNEFPEGYSHDWVKIDLKPGDVLIMPPGTPHAVVTNEPCLAVGGNFYTASTLAQSLEALHINEQFPAISNEDTEPDDYIRLMNVLKDAEDAIADRFHPAIIASCALFYDPRAATEFLAPSYSGPYAREKRQWLAHEAADRGIPFPDKATKDVLIALLTHDDEQEQGAPAAGFSRRLVAASTAREKFLWAVQEFCKEWYHKKRVIHPVDGAAA